MTFDSMGAGAPLVLLHAFPFDRRMWRQTAEALAAGRRVLVPDMRGFGGSPLGVGFSIADLADDLAAFLDTLGLPRAAVGGLSMGGYVALAFAHRYPERLDALVLADTKAGADSPQAQQGRDQAIALVRELGVGAFVERQLPKLLSPSAAPQLRASARAIALDQSGEAVIAALQALRDRPDRRDELGGIACPTLVVVGSEDVLTPPAEAAAMASAIPGARLVTIPGAGHLANLEAPAAFEAVLAAFFGPSGPDPGRA